MTRHLVLSLSMSKPQPPPSLKSKTVSSSASINEPSASFRTMSKSNPRASAPIPELVDEWLDSLLTGAGTSTACWRSKKFLIILEFPGGN